jgi:hypothetical protein
MTAPELIVAIIYSCFITYAAVYSLSLKHGHAEAAKNKVINSMDTSVPMEHSQNTKSLETVVK